MKKLPISVIVLTFNEEQNIQDCLESVHNWVEDVFVVDSYSTDSTINIVEKYSKNVFQNEFENYSQQRNWAIVNLPIKTDWILNLDADHRVTNELKNELFEVFSANNLNDINGFLLSRKTIFMKRWIKYGGHYPAYHSPLFRINKGFCENKLYDQHFVVKGKIQKLNSSIIDIITDSLSNFVSRHNKWSNLEAEEIIKIMGNEKETVKADLFGNPIERKRYYKNIYYRFPIFLRSFLYFCYRYFIRLGFLDGKEGLIFHFLQGFWFRFLIDSKVYEQREKIKNQK